jgi:hypothetical protein
MTYTKRALAFAFVTAIALSAGTPVEAKNLSSRHALVIKHGHHVNARDFKAYWGDGDDIFAGIAGAALGAGIVAAATNDGYPAYAGYQQYNYYYAQPNDGYVPASTVYYDGGFDPFW